MLIEFLAIILQQSSHSHGGEWMVEHQNLFSIGDSTSVTAWESIGDLDGDLGEEVVVALPAIADYDIIRIDSGVGGLDWRVSWNALHSEAPNSPPGWMERIGDVNNDGIPDILIGSHSPLDPGFAVILSGVNGAQIWALSHPGIYEGFGDSGCRLDDIDGDGVDDFLLLSHLNFASFSPELTAFSGATRDIIWSRDTYAQGWGWISAIGDLDGFDFNNDGLPDVLLSGGGSLIVTSSLDGATIFTLTGQGVIANKNGSKVTAVGPDLDGDGFGELVVETLNFPTAQRVCLNPATGLTNWTQVDLEPYSFGTISIPDQNGDGLRDFAVGIPTLTSGGSPDGGKIAILCAATGERIRYIRGGSRNTEGIELGEFLASSTNGSATIIASQVLGPNGVPGSAMQFQFQPYITTSSPEVSASLPIAIDIALDFPVEYANHPYGALFSWAGYGPTDIGNISVPLTWDPLFQQSVQGNLPSAISSERGVLDSTGNAIVEIDLPPGVASPLIGRRLHISAVIADPGLASLLVSSAGVGVLIAP